MVQSASPGRGGLSAWSGGVSAPGGVCLVREGGVCLVGGGCLSGPGGVSAWSSGGVCLVWGGLPGLGGWCLLPGGLVSAPRGGCYPSMHWGRPPPLWTEWMTDRCKNITLATTSLRPVIKWWANSCGSAIESLRTIHFTCLFNQSEIDSKNDVAENIEFSTYCYCLHGKSSVYNTLQYRGFATTPYNVKYLITVFYAYFWHFVVPGKHFRVWWCVWHKWPNFPHGLAVTRFGSL